MTINELRLRIMSLRAGGKLTTPTEELAVNLLLDADLLSYAVSSRMKGLAMDLLQAANRLDTGEPIADTGVVLDRGSEIDRECGQLFLFVESATRLLNALEDGAELPRMPSLELH